MGRNRWLDGYFVKFLIIPSVTEAIVRAEMSHVIATRSMYSGNNNEVLSFHGPASFVRELAKCNCTFLCWKGTHTRSLQHIEYFTDGSAQERKMLKGCMKFGYVYWNFY